MEYKAHECGSIAAERNALMRQIRIENEQQEKKLGRKPRAYSQVYGCKQNEADMERIRGMLCEMGYQPCDQPADADLIIINTCAVREGAQFRIYGNVGAFKPLKEKNPQLIIAVCGCMMQQEQEVEKMRKSYPYVDLIFGTHNIGDFPWLLEQKRKTGKRVIAVEKEGRRIEEGIPIVRTSPFSALVTVMYGCNNFCSYCIVPYTRGRERSRQKEEILQEVHQLGQEGCLEVTLLGQNVNSYGKDLEPRVSFAQLLREINEIPGIERIRFITSHPKDLSDELIAAMAQCEKVCPSLHLPFQAGSNRILKLMNRGYTRESYLELVDRIRAKIPDISLTSDVIVGFPTETDEDFEQTLDLIKKVRFDMLFSFIYSKRPGTPAAKMEDGRSRQEIQKNFDRLLELEREIGYENNQKELGRVHQVLVENVSKSDEAFLTGRSAANKLIHFQGDKSLIGTLVNVKIVRVMTWYMVGELIEKNGD